MTVKTWQSKPLRYSKSSSKREVSSNTILPKRTRKKKISNKQSHLLHLKQLEKEDQRKPKVSRRKQIINVRVEINEIENKKIIDQWN